MSCQVNTCFRCALYSKLFGFGFFPELYDRTSMYVYLYSFGTHPGIYPRYRQGEHVSPPQTTLLKLLDSFLQHVPSFRGGDENIRKLSGFLVSAFFSQAENVQRAIQQATGVSPSDQDDLTDKLGTGGTAQQAANGLDVRLPGVCVALILLSTSLSSILLSERENREIQGGACTDPNLVRLTLPCRDTIAGSGNSTGTGFIEFLIGMVVS
jgi:hypothetical protein